MIENLVMKFLVENRSEVKVVFKNFNIKGYWYIFL